MNRRNWLDLSRKLVDRFDLDYTENAIEAAIDSYAEDYYGAGVAQTPEFPNGLAVTLSGGLLQAGISAGVGFDASGNRSRVATTQTLPIATPNLTLPRWDLIVLRYKKTGIDPVPKPSNPIMTVFLNLKDDYDLVYLSGTASVSPSYPTPLTNDIILAGVQVPSSALVGTDCTLDDTVRMFAVPPASRLLRKFYATVIPGTSNQQWLMPQTPTDPLSAVVFVDSVPQGDGDYQISGNVITFALASIPEPGREVFAIILIGQTGAMAQAANTIPNGKMSVKKIGVGDGVADTFLLPVLPIDPGSVAIMVDGGLQNETQYTVTGQSIIFTAGNIPAVGLEVASIVLYGATSIVGVISPVGGSGLLQPYGSRGAPLIVAPGTSVVVAADDRQMRFIALAAASGAQPMTAIPQIAPGTSIGQELILKGRSAADYPIFHDGDGLELNGPWNGSITQSLSLVWDGAVWSENGRKL